MEKEKNNSLSIIVCCYNSGNLLERCLDSLANQTIASTEYKVVFINDGSTDDSLEIAQSYLNRLKDFTVLDNKSNKGLVNCCNSALGIIDTPYFMRLDADDYLSFDAIDKISTELKTSLKSEFIVFKRWDICGGEFKEEEIKDMYSWIAVGTVFNAEAVTAVGGYSDEYWEEYDLYIKLLEAGNKYRVSPHRIYYYRRGHESMTQDDKKKKEGFESLIKKWGISILRKHGDYEGALEYYGLKKGLNV